MYKIHSIKNLIYTLVFLSFLTAGFFHPKTEVLAATFPNIAVDFDPSDQSVIVSGIPTYDSTGAIHYELRGYLNYGNERVETFCYAPHTFPYHVADKQAYIFNWADSEFLLPCSGEYKFTTYLVAVTPSSGAREEGPKTTITITLTKKDESTNWGPGLPNTTVEPYYLNEIKGTDKSITMEEEGYTWNINGNNIETVPEENLSLAITKNPENFPTKGIDDFFGNTIAAKFSIDHNGAFGFDATLDYYVGTEYAGKYANLFFVVGDGTFEFREGGLVDENGMVSYTFNHASDYIIAVTDTEYTGQELNPKSEEPIANSTTEQDTQTITSDKTNENSQTSKTENQTETNTTNFPLGLILIVVAALFVVGIILVIKKNKR